jgi:hypothetical protein
MTKSAEKSPSSRIEDSFDQASPSQGITRREAIRKTGLVVAGLCIASIGGAALIGVFDEKLTRSTLTNTSDESSNASAIVAMNAPLTSAFVTVKVVYFGMSTQTGGVKQEYITLTNPAHLEDAISVVTSRHPAIIPMIGGMQIMIDGNSTEPDQLLANKDELDFIPLLPGG